MFVGYLICLWVTVVCFLSFVLTWFISGVVMVYFGFALTLCLFSWCLGTFCVDCVYICSLLCLDNHFCAITLNCLQVWLCGFWGF